MPLLLRELDLKWKYSVSHFHAIYTISTLTIETNNKNPPLHMFSMHFISNIVRLRKTNAELKWLEVRTLKDHKEEIYTQTNSTYDIHIVPDIWTIVEKRNKIPDCCRSAQQNSIDILSRGQNLWLFWLEWDVSCLVTRSNFAWLHCFQMHNIFEAQRIFWFSSISAM